MTFERKVGEKIKLQPAVRMGIYFDADHFGQGEVFHAEWQAEPSGIGPQVEKRERGVECMNGMNSTWPRQGTHEPVARHLRHGQSAFVGPGIGIW
jgi:hypothetical protein